MAQFPSDGIVVEEGDQSGMGMGSWWQRAISRPWKRDEGHTPYHLPPQQIEKEMSAASFVAVKSLYPLDARSYAILPRVFHYEDVTLGPWLRHGGHAHPEPHGGVRVR
jgi:hypothetical protein